MKKIIAAAAFATMLLPSVSFAETMQFPSDAPVAEITIPDSWSPEETETGIQATSEDEAIYLSIDVADEKTTDKVIEDAIAFLDDNGVTIDPATQKQSEDTFNGMKMSNFDWSGTDKDGTAIIVHGNEDQGITGAPKSGVSGGPRVACGVLMKK